MKYLIIFILINVCFPSTIKPQSNEAEEYYKYASSRCYPSNYFDAINYFSKAIFLDPSNTRYLNGRGKAYFDSIYYGNIPNGSVHEFSNAINDFEAVLKIDSTSHIANSYLGLIYYTLGENNTCIMYYTNAIHYNKEINYEDFIGRYRAYTKIDKLDYAIEDLNKLLIIDPESPNYFGWRADLYNKLKNYENAILDYTSAINLWDKMGISTAFEMRYKRARAYFEIDRFFLAIEDYSFIINKFPDNLNSYIGRGICYNFIDKYDMAILDYNKALFISPENDLAYHQRGLAFANLSEYTLAISDLEKAISLNSNNEIILRPIINELKNK